MGKNFEASYAYLIITRHKKRFNNVTSRLSKRSTIRRLSISRTLVHILVFRYSETNFRLFASRQGMILSGIFLASASRRHRRRRYRGTVTIVDVKSREGAGEREREREN